MWWLQGRREKEKGGGEGGQAEAQEGLHTRQIPNVWLFLCSLRPGKPHKGIGGQEQNCSQITGRKKRKSLEGNEK